MEKIIKVENIGYDVYVNNSLVGEGGWENESDAIFYAWEEWGEMCKSGKFEELSVLRITSGFDSEGNWTNEEETVLDFDVLIDKINEIKSSSKYEEIEVRGSVIEVLEYESDDVIYKHIFVFEIKDSEFELASYVVNRYYGGLLESTESRIIK